MAIFVARADVLETFVKINKRDPDRGEGYQRTLSASRVEAIARYLRNGHPIPTAMVVALDRAKIIGAELVIPAKSVGWVIDGQHRFEGALLAGGSLSLPVVAFVELNVEQQIEQFVTINREAKGVPTSLYLDLLKDLPGQKSDGELAKERASDLARQLKVDEESPFSGRVVVMASPKRGELSLTNFVRKVAPLVNRKQGILGSFSNIDQRDVLDNYYKGFKNVFPDEFDRADSIFFQTIGFGAAMNALPQVFTTTLKAQQGFRVADVAAVLAPISDFDFEVWRQGGTGNAAEVQAGDSLISELQRRMGLSPDSGSLRLR